MAGQAPGALAGTPRKTKVRMVPMWCPWDNLDEKTGKAKGGIRLIPADTTHKATIEDNLGGPALPYYEAKGYVPLRQFTPEMHAELASAAAAAREHAAKLGGAVPAWATSVQVPASVDAA